MMNEKELKILIIAYACVVIGTILITGNYEQTEGNQMQSLRLLLCQNNKLNAKGMFT